MSGTFNRMQFFGRRGSRKGRYAFTLVELLVVVAIIALLVSILLPTLGRAKASAKLVICLTQLNSIGKAAWLYSAENNDYVPRDADYYGPCSHDPPYYFFGARLSPYLGGPVIPFEYENDDDYLYEVFKDIDMYMCPSFKACFQDYVLTYISNGYNFKTPTQWGTPALKLADLPVPPADVVYLAELNPLWLPAGKPGDAEAFGKYDFLAMREDDDAGAILLHNATFNENGLPNTTRCRMISFDDNRHDRRTTVAYFDGHAESKWLTAEEMPTQLFFPK